LTRRGRRARVSGEGKLKTEIPVWMKKNGGEPMSCNVGGIERGLRILLGLTLLGVAFLHVLTGGLAILAYVLGGIAMVTGLVGFCPAWAMFGINTCAMKHPKAGGSGQ
jgi:hypothetical protein